MTSRSAFLNIALVAALLTLAAPRPAQAQFWSLEQNDPNPFCPAEGPTAIRFAVATSAPILLEVWNADATEIVATLVNAVLAAGFHEVIWSGTDGGGAQVPDGSYVYRMTAGDIPILFEDEKTLDVTCAPSSAAFPSWGRVKALYR